MPLRPSFTEGVSIEITAQPCFPCQIQQRALQVQWRLPSTCFRAGLVIGVALSGLFFYFGEPRGSRMASEKRVSAL